MDHLLDLLDEDAAQDDSPMVESAASMGSSPSRPRHETANDEDNQTSVCVDDKIGIRMINRKISSVDTLDLLNEYPYHSPASLSSFSLQNLNNLLVDPAAVVDASTVAGKMSLITMGLIFSNSGSRTSQSGNTFCKLQIGNLYTGPTVTVLLFGTSIKHCTLKVGTVVAIINPRLLPSTEKKDKQTTVCLSISDHEQLIHIAQARDYGRCKGSCRAKVDGQWVEHGKRCQNYVDTRVSEYCKTHLKQQQNKNQKKGSLQKLRDDAQLLPTATGRQLHPPSFDQQSQSNFLWSSSLRSHRPHSRQEQKRAGNSLLSTASNAQRLSTISSRPTFGTRSNTNNSLLASAPTLSNPYAASTPRVPAMKKTATPRTTTTAGSTKKRIVTGDALSQPKKKQKQTGKVRSINTDVAGFDGSVKVPQPSKIFQKRRVADSNIHARTATLAVQSTLSIETILSQQKQAALKLKQAKRSKNSLLSSGPTSIRPASSKKVPGSSRQYLDRGSKKAAAREFLSDIIINVDATIKAESRYKDAADAEEYARSRQIVNELEEEEEKKLSTKVKKDRDGLITATYKCAKCQRTFPNKPVACLRAKHSVKTIRSVRETASIQDQRLKTSNADPADGGLRLGQGLEWSRQRYN